MTATAWLVLYSALIVMGSVAGGYLPLLGRVTHSRLQLYLSASAGVMLGASFFHVMPEAIDRTGTVGFGWWMSLGVVGLFCIERFIAPHSHEIDGGGHHDHAGAHHHDHEHHEHQHDQPVAAVKEPRAAAPAVAGWMAVLGLTIHTFMNGFGLAGAVEAGLSTHTVLPGFALFLAIVLHKPADALAISTVLSRKGVSRRKLLLVQYCFAAMIPVGAAAFVLAQEVIEDRLKDQLTGAALAFSAGTFLFIALSDLLPEVQFHRHDRIPLFLALVLGVVFMGGIAYLEPHEEPATKTSKK
ncbi:MAG TPA: ZIP family metal transporter [Gemmataceae bacterium]|nr:ZIP family metal transporter [Gemmataceae bacterium]